MSSRSTPASASASANRTLVLVALYAPVVDRKHVFNLVAGPKPLGCVPFGECHTAAPYTITGRTTVV